MSNIPSSLDHLEVGEYLKPLKDYGEMEARELWVCSYCEHLAGGGEADEAGTVEADLFFQKYTTPEYRVDPVGEIRAGEDSEVTGLCDVCSSLDGLGQIELARMES